MKKFAIVLTLFLATNVFAGAGWVCDDYGNSCLAPGGNCRAVIPPVHICSDEENDFQVQQGQFINSFMEQNTEESFSPKGATLEPLTRCEIFSLSN